MLIGAIDRGGSDPPEGSRQLPDLLWLGGSACAGKTRVARLLAGEHGLTLYSCDERFPAHRERADPLLFPAFCRLAAAPDEVLWAGPVEERVADLIAFYEDELHLVLEDLAEMRAAAGEGAGPVLVEGAGLLPWRVLPLCRDPRRALWLVAGSEFRRRHHPRRGPWVEELLREAAAPPDALERWMERDERYGEAIAAAAAERGGRVLGVDGSLGPRELAAEAARCFRLAPGAAGSPVP